MSAIDHRKRLNQKRAGIPAKSVTTVTPPESQKQPAEVVPVDEQPLVNDDPKVIVPEPLEKHAMTPEELRNHAKQLAVNMAQFDQENYENALAALEANNPSLYGAVV